MLCLYERLEIDVLPLPHGSRVKPGMTIFYMKRGKFIVLYGINNIGKTTQAKLLAEKLNSAGLKTEYLKYPIYDLEPSGKLLNNYLREGNIYNLTPREAQIIYALNRTQYEKKLLAKLESGINVSKQRCLGLLINIGSMRGKFFRNKFWMALA